jgi:hypothetical protein
MGSYRSRRHVAYGQEDLLVADLDLTKATRFYATRYAPGLYQEHSR